MAYLQIYGGHMRRNPARDAKRASAVDARDREMVQWSGKGWPEWMTNRDLLPKKPPSAPKLPEDPHG